MLPTLPCCSLRTGGRRHHRLSRSRERIEDQLPKWSRDEIAIGKLLFEQTTHTSDLERTRQEVREEKATSTGRQPTRTYLAFIVRGSDQSLQDTSEERKERRQRSSLT